MSQILLIVLTLGAAAVGTMTGFGTSTIMVPVLAIFLPLSQTLLFVGVIHWFGDIWKIAFFKKGLDWKLIILFGIPGVITSFLAARLPILLSSLWLQRLLGIFLIIYVYFLVKKSRWKIKASNQNALLGGTLSGFFAGVFGVGGAIRSAFLSAFDLDKSRFIFISGVIGLLIDSSRLVQYYLSKVELNNGLNFALILCIPVSFLGAYLAKRIVERTPQKLFRFLVALALFLVGLRYLIFS